MKKGILLLLAVILNDPDTVLLSLPWMEDLKLAQFRNQRLAAVGNVLIIKTTMYWALLPLPMREVTALI